MLKQNCEGLSMPIRLTMGSRVTETLSEGDQEKLLADDRWYKLDRFSYEELTETVTSALLVQTNADTLGFAVLRRGDGSDHCPIFDFSAGLLSNTRNHPLEVKPARRLNAQPMKVGFIRQVHAVKGFYKRSFAAAFSKKSPWSPFRSHWSFAPNGMSPM